MGREMSENKFYLRLIPLSVGAGIEAIECGGTNQPLPRGCETTERSADLEISNLALKYILGKCHVTSYRSLEWALEAALQFQHCMVQ